MKRLELLDYGRFFAAIIVVLFHYTFNGIANGKIDSISHIAPVIEFSKYGYLGVELFFMISGYVIFFSARNRTCSGFAVSRAIRLYPAYWFAVLFTSFFALKWGGKFMSVYPGQIIANLSMLQSFLGIGHVDAVYWTLIYEISFYFGVLLLLMFGLQKKLHFLFICWPILFCIAIALDKQSLPYLGNYYYYFSAGALFAVLKERVDWRAVLSLFVSFILAINFAITKSVQFEEARGVDYSPTAVGLIVTLFFAFFIYQNTKKAQLLKLPMSKLFGALTYPVYLIHASFGYIFLNQFATEENKVEMYALIISLVLVIAYLIHKIIEVQLSQIWVKVFNLTLGSTINYIEKLPSILQMFYGKLIATWQGIWHSFK